jgi:hypothetical protein
MARINDVHQAAQRKNLAASVGVERPYLKPEDDPALVRVLTSSLTAHSPCVLDGSLRSFHSGEEHINKGICGALKLCIALAPCDPGEQTVENISGQRIVQEDC